MAISYIPSQPLKWWDDFETAKLECECFSKQFCLPNILGEDLYFILQNDSVATQLFSNYDFSSTLTDWSQNGTGTSWAASSCLGEDTAATTAESQWLYQDVNIKDGYCYSVCIKLCSEIPVSNPDCGIEIGYNSSGAGGTWTVLYSGFATNLVTEQCAGIDLSSLTPDTYAIGIRFTDAGACAASFDLEYFELNELQCEVEVKDCECDDVLATFGAIAYNESTGQQLYSFNASDLGLSVGQYRISAADIGCSSCIEVVDDVPCGYQFLANGNADGTFGFTWSLFTGEQGFTAILDNCEIRYAGYVDKESVTYRDSAFKNKLPYFNKQKKYTLVIDRLPEYMHDYFAIMCAGSEYFIIVIDGNLKRFRINPESYEPIWNKETDLASVKIELWEYQEYDKININTSNMD